METVETVFPQRNNTEMKNIFYTWQTHDITK